jgi:hypothetical protein
MSKRILVVEDRDDNRRIIRDLVTSVGYELIEAEDGEAGVRLAGSERPDLILILERATRRATMTALRGGTLQCSVRVRRRLQSGSRHMPTKDELETELEAAHRKIERLERKAEKGDEKPARRLSITEMEKLKRADGDLSVLRKGK